MFSDFRSGEIFSGTLILQFGRFVVRGGFDFGEF